MFNFLRSLPEYFVSYLIFTNVQLLKTHIEILVKRGHLLWIQVSPSRLVLPTPPWGNISGVDAKMNWVKLSPR